MDNKIILAAGGVLWRFNSNKKVEIALIHRDRYNDWSLPKGKLDDGESLIQTALREIKEETGIEAVFGPYLGQVQYQVTTGIKEVHYWSARAITPINTFQPNEEVDEIRWLDSKAAINLLTRESDRAILNKFTKLPNKTNTLILLRHAKAIARSQWQGEDEDRPLDILGQYQAKEILKNYLPFKVKEIYSSDAVRCLDTVNPLSDFLPLEIRVSRELSEYAFHKNPERPWKQIKKIRDKFFEKNRNILICGHNPILPEILKKLNRKSKAKVEKLDLAPGAGWVLHYNRKRIIQIDYMEAPSNNLFS